MKIPRIPETELANICSLPVDFRYRALSQLRDGWGPFSYDPIKLSSPDILNAGTELFGQAEPTSLEQIRKRIIALSRRGAEEAAANLEVTECLHQWAIENNVWAKQYDIPPYHLSGAVGIAYSFWLPLVLIVEDRLIIPFLDPRRAGGLSPSGRRFAFSMIHHRARVLDPDLANAELAVFAFPVITALDGIERRKIRTHFAGDDPLFSYEQLDRVVIETYELWLQVLAERRVKARRASGGKRGDLL